MIRVLIEPKAAYTAIGVMNVVSRISQRLIPSTATCQRMPKAGIHSWIETKCQPVDMGTVRSISESAKPRPSTASVNPRSSPSSWRGMNSTATAPMNGRKIRTLSRCGHSFAAACAAPASSGQRACTENTRKAAMRPSPARSLTLSRRGIAAPTMPAMIAGQ